MPVFKVYLKIIQKNLGVVISYMVIFIAICVMITMNITNKKDSSFEATRLSMMVVDEDDSAVSHALVDFLSESNNVTMADMDKERLSRLLYSRNTSYVLRIPEGFGEGFADGSVKLDVTKVPDSSTGYLLDNTVSNFVKTAAAFVKSGYTAEEAVEKTAQAIENDPDVKMVETGRISENDRENYAYLFTYFPYLYISLMIYCISYVLMAFSSREIRSRMLIAPISSVSQTVQSVLAFGLLFIVFWLVSLLLPLTVQGENFYTSPLAGYYVLNTFALLLVSGAIGFLAGNLVHGSEGIAAMANIISLGCSFLCGVFVPMEYLGEGVKKIAHFLPIYWYEVANNILSENTSLSSSNRAELFGCLGIQAAFALAIIVVTLFIVKKKNEQA